MWRPLGVGVLLELGGAALDLALDVVGRGLRRPVLAAGEALPVRLLALPQLTCRSSLVPQALADATVVSRQSVTASGAIFMPWPSRSSRPFCSLTYLLSSNRPMWTSPARPR